MYVLMPLRNSSDGLPVGMDHVSTSAPKTVSDINSQGRITNAFVFPTSHIILFFF